MKQFSTSFSSSFSSEPRDSEALMIPIMGSGSDLPPVYLSVFTMEADRKPPNRVSSEYYNKPWLTKAEVLLCLGWSSTTLDRLSKEYPFIKYKIPKTGSILFSKEQLDKVIKGEYN